MSADSDRVTTQAFRVPCQVTAKVTLSERGAARVEEYARQVMAEQTWLSLDEATHVVLVNIVEWMGAHGRHCSNLDGYADLDDDDITVGPDEWEPSSVDDVEEVDA